MTTIPIRISINVSIYYPKPKEYVAKKHHTKF